MTQATTGFLKKVRASGDDYGAPKHTGAFNSTDGNYYIGNNGTAAKIGIRIALPIPTGVTIASAKLQLTCVGTNAGTPNLLIRGILGDNPSAPASNAASDALTRTTATVTWSLSAGTSSNEIIESPDISTILQEIVDQGTWTNGDAVILMIETDSSSGNYRRIYTFDQGDKIPAVSVSWNVAGTTNTYTFYDSGRWTPDSDATITAVCRGAGGAGGYATATSRAGGGGGGAWATGTASVTGSTNYTASVGRSRGTIGYDSNFVDASTVMAKGGTSGDDNMAGGAGNGGAGGQAASSVGTTKRDGGSGANGGATKGGGGGGSATSSAAGNSAVADAGGTDGDSVASGGDAGTGQGNPGADYGGGGAGGGNAGSSSNADGGRGLVVITWAAVTAPVADFTGTPLTGTTPLTVVFTDSSTNTPTSWLWEKNSGSGWVNFSGSPTSQNPTESFTTGTWSVRLTATNAGGSDTKTRTGYITVSAAGGTSSRFILLEA